MYKRQDLKHYEQLPSPLNRMSQLNMVGEGDSCGVWAPDISWDGECFWLIYTDVKTRTGEMCIRDRNSTDQCLALIQKSLCRFLLAVLPLQHLFKNTEGNGWLRGCT